MVRSFAVGGEEMTESRRYELSMLTKEFFPEAEIREEDPEYLFVYAEACWRLYGKREEPSADRKLLLTCSNDGIPQMAFAGGDPLKNRMKQGLYALLSEWTDRALPWGILTGVKPVKLAVSILDTGRDRTEAKKILRDEYSLSPTKTELLLDTAVREIELLTADERDGREWAIYIGIPFCPTRCAYCSFVSYDYHMLGDLMDRYVDALIREIRACGELAAGRRITSLYMGGGTPTSLSAEQMDRVLTEADRAFHFDRIPETTVEAGRPDTITMDKLKVLSGHGISRISVNPQTMNQKTLDRIGRRHSVEDVIHAYEMARTAGFDNINMDLIMGLPGETVRDVEYTVRKIRELAPDSLTVHSLAIKRSSRLKETGLYSDASAEEIEQMLTLGQETAAVLGMRPYYLYRQKNMAGNFENTGYCAPGKECMYNIEIMEEKQNICAMGAGSVSKVYDPARDRIDRISNVKNAGDYITRLDEMIERKRRGFGN